MEEHARRKAENAVRLANLEQSDKEKTELIAKLNYDIGEIMQERVTINVLVHDGPEELNHMSEKCEEIPGVSDLITNHVSGDR